MENTKAFSLALISGILLIISGSTGSIGLIGDIVAFFAPTLSPEALAAVTLVLTILNIVAMLGGISVIIGGFLFTKGRVGTGKFIIGIGAGMGLIGVLIILITLALNGALTVSMWVALFQSTSWIGIILSIIARMSAK